MKTKMNLLSPEKKVSNLQMSLTLILVLNLILANILVVKPINLLGFEYLANTVAIITFPVTYLISDIFSEVYGYRWSRITATWAFLGTAMASILFTIGIAIPGNDAWQHQSAMEMILGNTPTIALASVIAFWFGDLMNDKVFRFLKNKNDSHKFFPIRAIGSSLAGKYTDGLIFTFLGLHFLPLETKIIMVATAPFVQIVIETLCLPITMKAVKIIKKIEKIS